MSPSLRKRLIVVAGMIAVVIIAITATAVVALRLSSRQVVDRDVIDRRLARVEQLRGHTRELALVARRHVVAADAEEHARALEIAATISEQRARLAAGTFSPHGRALDGALEVYVTTLVEADSSSADPLERLAQFEDNYERARRPLAMTYDLVVSRERARRDASASVAGLTRGAQWAVLLGGALAVSLTLFGVRIVLRQHAATSTPAAVTPPVRPSGPTMRSSYEQVALDAAEREPEVLR
jgi:hypothetical protein